MSIDKSNMSPEQNVNPLYMATSRSENSTLNQLNSPALKMANQNLNNKNRPIVLLNRVLPASQDNIADVLSEISEPEEGKLSLSCPKRHNILKKAKNTPIFNSVNCEEKIIFCIDISDELQSSSIINGSIVGFIKRYITFFLAIRKLIKITDEFAIIVLTDEAIWLCDFTIENSNLMKSLEEIDICHSTECDLNTIFDLLVKTKNLATPAIMINNAPSYIHRIILLYGRTNTMPRLNIKKYGSLLRLETIFVDVIFIHEPLNDENFDQINKIYNQLCELDQRGFSYIFHLSEDIAKFQEYFAKLTAHPLQRQNQSLHDRINNEGNLDPQ